MQNHKPSTHYAGLDLFKYLAACLVVVLHAVESDNVYASGVVYILTRFAVPFFFISSGFLFHRGVTGAPVPRTYFQKYIKKLLILFAFWGVAIYGLLTVRDYFISEKENGAAKNLLLTLRRIFVIGPGVTWYLLALLLSIGIIYLLFHFQKTSLLIPLVAVGFCLNFIYTNAETLGLTFEPITAFRNAITFVYSNANNVILTGLPFTGLGFLLAKYKRTYRFSLSLAFFLLATATCVIEYVCLARLGRTVTVSFALQAVGFFCAAIRFPGRLKYAKQLRSASTVTYLVHWLLLYEIMNPVLRMIGINPYQLYLIPIKTAVTVALCFGIYRLIMILGNRRLKLLFGI